MSLTPKEQAEALRAYHAWIRLTVGLLVGDCVASLTTLIRLVHRFRRRQLWWDDFWAFMAFLCAVFTVTVAFVNAFPKYDPQGIKPPFSLRTYSFLSWSNFFSQPGVIWTSRLSIQATVIRFLPPGRNLLISRIAFGGLCLVWILASISKIFYCGIPIPTVPFCWFAKAPSVINLACNILATAWLVAWPAYILARMNLARAHRRLFIICFSTAGLLVVVDTLHGASLIVEAYERLNITGHLEVMVSLLTSNLLVLATYFYRVYRGGSSEANESGDGPGLSDDSSKQEESTRMRPTRHAVTTTMTGTSRRRTSESSIGPLTTINTDDNAWSESRLDTFRSSINPLSAENSALSQSKNDETDSRRTDRT